MTDPKAWTDRWFRRYRGDIPIELQRKSIDYAMVEVSAAWRPGKRAIIASLRPVLDAMARVLR